MQVSVSSKSFMRQIFVHFNSDNKYFYVTNTKVTITCTILISMILLFQVFFQIRLKLWTSMTKMLLQGEKSKLEKLWTELSAEFFFALVLPRLMCCSRFALCTLYFAPLSHVHYITDHMLLAMAHAHCK